MQAAQTQRDAIRTARGTRGDDLPRGARGRVPALSTVSCTPPPAGAGGTGKTGAASQRGLYVTIHSHSRVPGNILQDFEVRRAWNDFLLNYPGARSS